ncbi:MAG: hypothetical protein ACRDTG_07755 [Pseudonocardiaceae bacterium]
MNDTSMAARPAVIRAWAVWVTSGADGTEHAVTDEQMTAGYAAKTGVYTAQCGMRVVAAAMVTPALRRCTPCLALLRPGGPARRAQRSRSAPLFSWTGRLLGPLRTSTAASSHPEDGVTTARRPDRSHRTARHAVGQP